MEENMDGSFGQSTRCLLSSSGILSTESCSNQRGIEKVLLVELACFEN